MKKNQAGTFADGQRGVIAHVYNDKFAIFQSDTGARFTILAEEFTPSGASAQEAASIASAHDQLFGHLAPADGFCFGVARRGGHVVEVWCYRLAPIYSPGEVKRRRWEQELAPRYANFGDSDGWRESYVALTGQQWPVGEDA